MSPSGVPYARQPAAQECAQYFSQLALGLANPAAGSSQPEVEPKPAEPAREPAPNACDKKVTILHY